MKKKRLVKVEGYDYDPYTVQEMGFAFVSNPKKGRKQCHDFVTCRDDFCDILRAAVLDESCSSRYNPGMNPEIDLSRLRLLLARDIKNPDRDFNNIRDKLFSGKRVLNYYEKLAGWKQSIITTVNLSTKSHAWLLTGPKNWMGYSNLMSMAILILRIACEEGPINFKTGKELEKEWIRLSKKNRRDCSKWLKECYKWFPILMSEHKSIFTQNIKTAYQPKAINYGGRGGIHSLITMDTDNPTLTKNIRRIGKQKKLI